MHEPLCMLGCYFFRDDNLSCWRLNSYFELECIKTISAHEHVLKHGSRRNGYFQTMITLRNARPTVKCVYNYQLV